jgi:hypothetical protein
MFARRKEEQQVSRDRDVMKECTNSSDPSVAHLVSMHTGTLSRKTISFEVTQALEGIEGHSAIKRRISLVILKELLKDVPNIINIRVRALLFFLNSYSRFSKFFLGSGRI